MTGTVKQRGWAERNRNNQAYDMKVHSKGKDLGLGDFRRYIDVQHTARL